MKTTHGRRWLLGVALLALLACGGPPPQQESGHQASSRHLVGGGAAPGDEAAVALVARRVRCNEAEPMLLCTGALIAPDLVLTAAHCLEIFGEAGQYEIFLGERLHPSRGRFVQVRQARRHPAYEAESHAFDVALLRLAAAVDVAPYPLPTGAGGPAPGDVARAVGFGETRDAGQPSGSRLQGDTRIVEVGEAAFTAAPDPAMSCTGDSGGPVLVEIDGEEVLAGITSHGDVACSREAVAVRVDAVLAEFILPVLEEEPPVPEAPDPALQPAALCTAACTQPADCPAGMDCVADAAGVGRCLLHTLQAGSFGEACTDDDACGQGSSCARLEAEGPEACRCFTPCDAPAAAPEEPTCAAGEAACAAGGRPSGGCASTGASGGGSGRLLAVVALLAWSRAAAMRPRALPERRTRNARGTVDARPPARLGPSGTHHEENIMKAQALLLGVLLALAGCGDDDSNDSGAGGIGGAGGIDGSGGMGGTGGTGGMGGTGGTGGTGGSGGMGGSEEASISATIDGTAWQGADNAGAIEHEDDEFVSVTAPTEGGLDVLGFQFPSSEPGTYSCGDHEYTSMNWLPEAGDSFEAGPEQGSCTITVDSSGAGWITGTFSGELENEDGTQTQAITDGAFTLPVVAL